MNHKFKQLITFFSLIVIFIFSGALNAPGEPLKVGIVDFRPFYIIESSTKLSGSMYDLMVKILEKAKLSYTIKGYPAKRLYTQLADGRSDFFMGVKEVPLYKDHVLYSKKAITELNLRIYGLADTVMPKNVKGLFGEKVLVITGYGYGGYRAKFLENPKSKIQLMENANHISAFRMLMVRRAGVKYLVDYKTPSEAAIKELGIKDVQEVSIFSLKAYLVVSKKTKNAKQVMAKLEKAYDDLVNSGEI